MTDLVLRLRGETDWLREGVKQKCKPRVHSQIFFFLNLNEFERKNNLQELQRVDLLGCRNTRRKH